jgi:hypothetical protein
MARLSGEFQTAAEWQSGVITRQQALQAGLTLGEIRARTESGRWQRLYPGVFAVFTGPPGRMTTLWAAVLKAGPGAVLSHQTAAGLAGLTYRASELIHVTVPAPRHVAPIPGVVVHRSTRAGQARHPSKSPPRTRIEETVLDLAQTARSFEDAYGWLSAACASRLTTPDRILAAMARRPQLRFRESLRLALGDIAGGAHTVLERHYAHNVERRHGLPPAERQVRAVRGGRTEYRDVQYRKYRVLVETDGRQAHPASARWRDAQRDNAAAALGLITLRYSWADVTLRACWVAEEVGRVLASRGWPGPLRRCGPGCLATTASAA